MSGSFLTVAFLFIAAIFLLIFSSNCQDVDQDFVVSMSLMLLVPMILVCGISAFGSSKLLRSLRFSSFFQFPMAFSYVFSWSQTHFRRSSRRLCLLLMPFELPLELRP